MSTMAQLPGFDQGMLAGISGGRNADPSSAKGTGGAAPTREEVHRALDDLRACDHPLAEEMAALLESMLQGGMPLPPGEGPNGRFVPPFAALLQGAAGNGAAQQQFNPADLSGTLDQVLATAEGAGDGALEVQLETVLGTMQNRSALFDNLLNRVEGVQASTVLAGGAPGPVPLPPVSVVGPTGVVSTQSLLSMPIPQPLTDPAWSGAIGERLVWMARGDQQFAELKITPPNLGPLEVRLNLNSDQASVSFVSNHAAVRDAIESAIPRLREMLAEQSLNLVQAEVGSGREQGADESGAERSGHGFAAGDGDPETSRLESDRVGPGSETGGIGLLDLFA